MCLRGNKREDSVDHVLLEEPPLSRVPLELYAELLRRRCLQIAVTMAGPLPRAVDPLPLPFLLSREEPAKVGVRPDAKVGVRCELQAGSGRPT